MKRFLICAVPRSGTGYIAKLLTNLGIPCGHESVFGLGEARGRFRGSLEAGADLSLPDTLGDSSWLAVPFLPVLPKDVIVIHQVRHPMAALKSLVGRELFTGNPRNKGYIDVIEEYALGVHNYTDEVSKSVAFWLDWNKQIEDHAHFRYQLETLSAEKLTKIADLVGHHRSLDDARKALDSTPTTVNIGWWHSDPDLKNTVEGLSLSGLSAPLQEGLKTLAKKYGY